MYTKVDMTVYCFFIIIVSIEPVLIYKTNNKKKIKKLHSYNINI